MESTQRLIEMLPLAPRKPKSKAQKVVRKTFKGTTQLSKLLPTGSVLTFQILCPVLTHQGQCPTQASRSLTLFLVFLCAFSCFLLSFTDSCRDQFGKVRYGLATATGLWVMDGSVELAGAEAEKYRLRFLDFAHATMSMLVFGAVTMFDKNVVRCLFPVPSEEVKELLMRLPIMVGFICVAFFLVFPTRRHGIGSPLSKE
ncbi:PREDICTED: uncharacterized protein LOC104824685 [Tarenaya hassleriana]|uniref:uncharacterized protein LOC104824685 n=1 Tax=Tarenaya hassleriana TaxID=28532 RepID=UPI00053C9447|nr:PREDICTED: uncharacterized protein LOC104824685 [Tarenaya hassleriana]